MGPGYLIAVRDRLVCEIGELLLRIMIRVPALKKECTTALYMLIYHRYDYFCPLAYNIVIMVANQPKPPARSKVARVLGVAKGGIDAHAVNNK